MKGIQFVVDGQGNKKAVQIDLRIHGRLWEDFCDAMIAKQRESEPYESLDAVKKKILGHKTRRPGKIQRQRNGKAQRAGSL